MTLDPTELVGVIVDPRPCGASFVGPEEAFTPFTRPARYRDGFRPGRLAVPCRSFRPPYDAGERLSSSFE